MNKKHIYIFTVIMMLFLAFGAYLGIEKKVIINADGQVIPVLTRSQTVGDLLKERNIAVSREDFIDPCLEKVIKEGDTICLKKAVPIEIVVDGEIRSITYHTLDKREILDKAGIELNEHDKLTGQLSKDVLPVHLQVVRVFETVIDVEEVVPFTKEQILDPEIKMGSRETVQQGADGLETRSYQVRYENGKETMRTVIASKVLVEMKKEITKLGTRNSILLASRGIGKPRKILYLEATAYTHTGNKTFTGVYPKIGTVAVDPKVIPLNSRLWIEGYGYGIAQDTGGLIKGNIIDLFMDTRAECLRWGRKKVNVYILE